MPDAENVTTTTGSGTSGQAKTSDDKPKTPAEATPPATPPAETEGSTSSTTVQPETSAPQSGDTNSSGQIYIPGFGWVENEGGGVEVEEAPNAGTGEKIGQ